MNGGYPPLTNNSAFSIYMQRSLAQQRGLSAEMIMSTETGYRAFPGIAKTKKTRFGDLDDTEEGMMLRDYFAAKAIGQLPPPSDYVGSKETEESYRKWANKAYKMADAMLRARESS